MNTRVKVIFPANPPDEPSRLGLPKTLLGVDAVLAGKLVGEDVNEKGILDLFERCRQRKIVVTPIGGNGFIFGRGSKQFTPDVIRQVGRENIVVVGTPEENRSFMERYNQLMSGEPHREMKK
jgi:predicted polyphosphate/ATP-dependent NAD kinase